MKWLISKFDLALFIGEKAEGLGGSLVYNAGLFTAAVIETLLNSAVAQPDTAIDLLEFQSAAEKIDQATEEDRIIAANRKGLRMSRDQRKRLSMNCQDFRENPDNS